MATPHRTAAFSAILTQLVNRLRLVLGRVDPDTGDPAIDDTYVRVVIAPNPDYAPYRAEEGVQLVVYPPEPASGGGRYDKKVRREVVTHVVTSNLLDLAGTDPIACTAHLTLEDSVIDAVTSFHPSVEATPGTSVNVTWKGGAQAQHRMVKQDQSLVISSLAFEVVYAQPFTIPTPTP